MNLFRKHSLLILFLLSGISFLTLYLLTHRTKYEKDVEQFQDQFISECAELERFAEFRRQDLHTSGSDELWGSMTDEPRFFLHVFKNDSLKFWNTGQVPVMRFASIHFPSQGINHLQNGWYYTVVKEDGPYTIAASLLIKRDYSYENKDLVNSFNSPFDLKPGVTLKIAEDEGYPIIDKSENYLFSIIPPSQHAIEKYEASILLVLLLLFLSLGLAYATNLRRRAPKKWRLLLPALVVFRLLSIYFGWFTFDDTIEFADPRLYGLNAFIPNLQELLIHLIFIAYLFIELRAYLQQFKFVRINPHVFAAGGILLIHLIYLLLITLPKSFIIHSTISFDMHELFRLDFYALLCIAILGILFLTYIRLLFSFFTKLSSLNYQGSSLSILLFVFGLAYLFYELSFGNRLLVSALFPIVISSFIAYLSYTRKPSVPLASGIFMLFLVAGISSSALDRFTAIDEKTERSVYATQLTDQKDLETEVEYTILSEEIKEDAFLRKFITNPINISFNDFQENLERRYFNGYWERYEMSFHLFDSSYTPLLRKQEGLSIDWNFFETLIEQTGEVSEVDSSIIYLHDNNEHLLYLVRQKISSSSGQHGYLICTLKSKKIPEEIGFPRLLVSNQANVPESLERYAIAKYKEGKLFTVYGDFEYPSEASILLKERRNGTAFFDFQGYNHYILLQKAGKYVVISKKNPVFFEELTSFSYLFCFFGILLLPLLISWNRSGQLVVVTLSSKIQISFFILILLSLVAFGLGSGVFVRNQYSEFTNNVIREKLSSVQTEVKAKLGSFDGLSIENDGDYINFILKKFAGVFFTDINLFDTKGYLLGTSRPKVFNIGLISDQMNPSAVSNLIYQKRSGYVHNEVIGNLSYASAYKPFFNSDGKLLAYINLQHFGQQDDFENQIQQFIVSIINVFILLLAFTLVIAALISNWLTAPLKVLHESLNKVRFGEHNERIRYHKKDEIGSLVAAYNRKLEELEQTAELLARNERESAWREMAKQVAHEIKNPLTPMKLSVQHLQRIYDPTDPDSKDKLEKVARSVIEQIDALAAIASEFSNFAKLPQMKEQEIDLIALIHSLSHVFNEENKLDIQIETKLQKLVVNADKDQLIRVFNNLIKNAAQAIPEGRQGLIRIQISIGKSLEIKVIDNGNGIPKHVRPNLFIPNFTTKTTGAGLGLAMVKQILENHQGSIDYDTREGEGSTFILSFPLSRVKESSF